MHKFVQNTKNELFDSIKVLLTEARKSVVRNINQTMVYTYFEIGRMIVEDELQGQCRAEYGKQVLIELSKRLTEEFGKGFSVDNLELMKKFYIAYSSQISETLFRKLQYAEKQDIEKSATLLRKSSSIPQTVSAEFAETISSTLLTKLQYAEKQDIEKYETLSRKSLPIRQTVSDELHIPHFQLSWSHYLKLMRIDDIAERQFYEIEAVNNQWSLRELQRQYDSALFQRLALSRDKQGILELSKKGQIIEKPEDAIKKNRILQCFLLIDLKIGDLTHQDIGQMQMYVNYYDRFVRLEHENKTIGIILCRDKNETLVKITLPEDNEQIFASRYQTVLPSKEELKKLIESKE